MENDHPASLGKDRGRGASGGELRPAGGGSVADRAGAGLKSLLLRFLTYRRAEALKTALAAGLYWSGAAWVAGRFRRRGAAILMYHSVGARGAFRDNVIPVAEFEAHLSFLARRFRVVPMADLLARLESGRAVPDDWVVLTFDDGYADNRRTVLPLLRKFGFPASFFPTVDVVSRGKRFFYDSIHDIVESAARPKVTVELDGRPAHFRLDGAERREEAVLRMVLAIRGRAAAERLAFVDALRLAVGASRGPGSPSALAVAPVGRTGSDGGDGVSGGEPLYLDPADLRALAEAGMEVGSHTLSHPNLAVLKNGELEDEIAESKVHLESITGAPVRGIAYPFGKRRHFNAAAVEAVRRAGYRYALTTEAGRAAAGASVFELPRLGPRGPLVRLKVNLMGIAL